MNKVIITGNLGKEPSTKYTQSGKAVCTFSVGVSSGWGDNKRTDWINVVAWDKRAETCGCQRWFKTLRNRSGCQRG